MSKKNKSAGEKWIQFLLQYGPTISNSGSESEHIKDLEQRFGIKRLKFIHPAETLFRSYFEKEARRKVVVLTGTAGDGKTTMLSELIDHLTGEEPDFTDKLAHIEVPAEHGGYKLTLIYDLSAWKKLDGDYLSQDRIDVLEKAAQFFTDESEGNPFVLAVNDGQLHEFSKMLPLSCSSALREMFNELLKLHKNPQKETDKRVALINLSQNPSAELMRLCLNELLGRKEWECLQTEQDKPIFGLHSSVPANYELLRTTEVQNKLISLAKIADASEYHLPIRAITILLVNCLLGHPSFKDQLVRPGAEAAKIFKTPSRHLGALHLNLFGVNLTPEERLRNDKKKDQRPIFRFLNRLRIGEETTNDIDDLIIFGKDHPLRGADYAKYVESDLWGQRDPDIQDYINDYIAGNLSADDQGVKLRHALEKERKRLFLHSPVNTITQKSIWVSSIFHHTTDYLTNYFDAVQESSPLETDAALKVACGLNRVWTGLLVSQSTENIYFTSGLDLTTSPVSDLLIKRLDLHEHDSGVRIEKSQNSAIPQFSIRSGEKKFSFSLSILIFEFLMRVAEGAMPTCFSNEVYANLLSLKQSALQKLQYRKPENKIRIIKLDDSGSIKPETITLKV